MLFQKTNLENAETWFSANKLSLNREKKNNNFVRPKKENKHDLIKINNTIIETMVAHRKNDIDEYVKFLGLGIDDKLHSNLILKKS